ncbi:CLUMA_CG002423, isoform A [Clunio marinus]|uniref:CLUMA_CG002423, isoform A n=1 Tax=Clunio marinus TaxID=568069 RepID=A0A1J1HKU1_9DIPT|nr:CLUMA_CG002423, isoform A [Clunio marinus]
MKYQYKQPNTQYKLGDTCVDMSETKGAENHLLVEETRTAQSRTLSIKYLKNLALHLADFRKRELMTLLTVAIETQMNS